MKVITHTPVLVDQVLHYLDPQPGKIYFDATFGAGGHTRALLEYQKKCTVIALDWEREALDVYGEPLRGEFGDRITLLWGNFAHLYKLLRSVGLQQIDGILVDFGPSTIQLKQKEGFSFNADTPLDMRMSSAHHRVTAAHILNEASERELATIFWEFGQERYSRQIARAVVNERKYRPIESTGQFVNLVVSVKGRDHKKIHPATQVFQALRMVVNKELENITAFLKAVPQVMRSQGRLVCISFHSLEDRLVKQFFVAEQKKGIIEILTPKVVVASSEEILANPSSRSARLRAALFY